jgi:transcriptional regulator with XRE-family HTH domain
LKTRGDRLRRGRNLKGLSQIKLAKLVGCAKSTISKLENNEVQDPKMSTIVPVCEALGISLDWYWHGRGFSPEFPDKVAQSVAEVVRQELSGGGTEE